MLVGLVVNKEYSPTWLASDMFFAINAILKSVPRLVDEVFSIVDISPNLGVVAREILSLAKLLMPIFIWTSSIPAQ